MELPTLNDFDVESFAGLHEFTASLERAYRAELERLRLEVSRLTAERDESRRVLRELFRSFQPPAGGEKLCETCTKPFSAPTAWTKVCPDCVKIGNERRAQAMRDGKAAKREERESVTSLSAGRSPDT